MRELVNQHFAEEQPAIGLLVDDRLVGIALIASAAAAPGHYRKLELADAHVADRRFPLHPPLSRLPRSRAGLPAAGAFPHVAAAGHTPGISGQHSGEQLLQALHNWCAEDDSSQGVVLDTGNPHYLEFYRRLGYEEVGEVAVGPIIEHVLFHPNPQVLAKARA